MKNIMIETHSNSLTCLHVLDLIIFPHVHREIEIVYAKKGHALCYADNLFHEIKTGEIFISFPNQVHYYLHSEQGEYYVFIFPAELIFELKDIFINKIPDYNVLHFDNKKEIESLADKIMFATGEYKETLQIGLLNQLISLCLPKMVLKDKVDVKSSSLQKILDYCTLHYTENITLDSVANALHFNKHHISHLINKKLSISFNTYINTLRINKAIQLMNEKKHTLSYISLEAGFGSIRSFNRVFKQIMNITPNTYYKLNILNRDAH